MDRFQQIISIRRALRDCYSKVEKFKIPDPNSGESQNDYVSRCMGVIGGEDKPQEQLIAMCIATYENK